MLLSLWQPRAFLSLQTTFSLCFHIISPLYVSLPVPKCLLHHPTGSGPTQQPHLNLIICKTLFSSTITFIGTKDSNFNILGRGYNSSHNMLLPPWLCYCHLLSGLLQQPNRSPCFQHCPSLQHLPSTADGMSFSDCKSDHVTPLLQIFTASHLPCIKAKALKRADKPCTVYPLPL